MAVDDITINGVALTDYATNVDYIEGGVQLAERPLLGASYGLNGTLPIPASFTPSQFKLRIWVSNVTAQGAPSTVAGWTPRKQLMQNLNKVMLALSTASGMLTIQREIPTVAANSGAATKKVYARCRIVGGVKPVVNRDHALIEVVFENPYVFWSDVTENVTTVFNPAGQNGAVNFVGQAEGSAPITDMTIVAYGPCSSWNFVWTNTDTSLGAATTQQLSFNRAIPDDSNLNINTITGVCLLGTADVSDQVISIGGFSKGLADVWPPYQGYVSTTGSTSALTRTVFRYRMKFL